MTGADFSLGKGVERGRRQRQKTHGVRHMAARLADSFRNLILAAAVGLGKTLIAPRLFDRI